MSAARRSKRGRASIPVEEEKPKPAKQRTQGFNWCNYVEEDTLAQFNKFVEPTNLLNRLSSYDWYPELINNWKYHYVLSWFYKVSESFITVTNSEYLNENVKKTVMWKDVKFDELTFLEDLINDVDNNDDYNLSTEDDDEGEVVASIYNKVKLRLLRQVSSNKSAQLADWDIIVRHNLELDHNQYYTFDELSVVEKFNVFYKLIKIIEKKNLVFRNYITLNDYVLRLFQFPEFIIDENKSLMILPNIGVIVEKITTKTKDAQLIIPLKLQNCTVKYEDSENSSVELVHLEYSNDIDEYIKSIHIEYKVLTSDWLSFVRYLETIQGKNPEIFNFISPYIQHYTEHLVYTRKLLSHREKERSMAELLTRRKRSSRLVAREEETKKKGIEVQWIDKLDSRDHFLKLKSRLLAKGNKKLKDIIWNEMRVNFEQDLKVAKLKHRTTNISTTNELVDPQFDNLTELDIDVIKNGTSYNQKIINITVPKANLDENHVTTREIPNEFCITNADIDEVANFGIDTTNEKADDMSWLFQCPTCHLPNKSEESDTIGIKVIKSEKDIDNNIMYNQILCCDVCLKWQHWECQNPKVIELLSWANTPKNKELHILTPRDMGVVTLGQQTGSRRSTRNKITEEEEMLQCRPTDKRKPIEERILFTCAYCINDIESDLGKIFVPELQALRIKKKKQQEDRERRKKQKEEKKKLVEQNQQLQLFSTELKPVVNTSSNYTPLVYTDSVSEYVRSTSIPLQANIQGNNLPPNIILSQPHIVAQSPLTAINPITVNNTLISTVANNTSAVESTISHSVSLNSTTTNKDPSILKNDLVDSTENFQPNSI